jgi:hypothetical protein
MAAEGWRGHVTAMGRPEHDPRSTEDFEAALWRETTVSLRQDPERWPWRRTTDTPDRHRKTRHREASWHAAGGPWAPSDRPGRESRAGEGLRGSWAAWWPLAGVIWGMDRRDQPAARSWRQIDELLAVHSAEMTEAAAKLALRTYGRTLRGRAEPRRKDDRPHHGRREDTDGDRE